MSMARLRSKEKEDERNIARNVCICVARDHVRQNYSPPPILLVEDGEAERLALVHKLGIKRLKRIEYIYEVFSKLGSLYFSHKIMFEDTGEVERTVVK